MPLLLLLATSLSAQTPSFNTLAREYDYTKTESPSVRQVVREKRNKVTIFDYSYDSPKGGRAPSFLVVPDGPGPFAVILFGHWMMPGSPKRNKTEFLDEAVLLARAGAICLLLDSPLVRPGITEDPDPLNGQSAFGQAQMVTDWRRGLDLLLSQPNADLRRVAYVGHSFSAAVGAKLTALEKRIGYFVLMAGGFANREYVFDEDNPAMVALRKKEGDHRIRSYFEKYPWDDPVYFAPRSAPAAVFLQYGRNDKPLPERVARRDYAHFAEPKQIAFYGAGHELNAAARLDRAKWLASRLKLGPLDIPALSALPQLK